MIDIAIAGATGRMGREVIKTLTQTKDVRLTRAFVSATSQYLDMPLNHIMDTTYTLECTHSFEPDFDVLIDFSTSSGLTSYLPQLVDSGRAVVICTTGFDQQQEKSIAQAAQKTPLLRASNTSLGITLLMQLVRYAVSRLPDADIEVIEAHHRNKVDAPSGTALSLGEAAADARGIGLDDAVYQRHGNVGIRPQGSIGFSTIRGGDIIGDHTVLLAMDQERVELSHKSGSRRLFAQGAIKAAQWLATQQAGKVYSMDNVLDGEVK